MDSEMEIVKGNPKIVEGITLDTIDRIVRTYRDGRNKPNMTITDHKTGLSVSGTGRSILRLKERLNKELDKLLEERKTNGRQETY